MKSEHRWNHVNFAVPPERLPLVEECIDTLFGWEKFVAKPYLLGYRLTDDMHDAALYFRPVPAVATLLESLGRLRQQDPALGGALEELDSIEGDWADHTGFMTGSVAESGSGFSSGSGGSSSGRAFRCARILTGLARCCGG